MPVQQTEKFFNSASLETLVGAIKEKTDAAYIHVDDADIASKSDIKISAIKVNGTRIVPVSEEISGVTEKVVNITTLTSEDVNTQITTALGGIKEFEIELVESLPTENVDYSTLYFVRNTETTGQNLYTEWIALRVDNPEQGEPEFTWEQIGEKMISLQGYATETWVTTNFLTQSDAATTYVAKDGDKVLSTNDFTDAYKNKVDSAVQTVNGNAASNGAVTLTTDDIDVDVNTTLTAALNDKVSKSEVLTEAEIRQIVANAWAGAAEGITVDDLTITVDTGHAGYFTVAQVKSVIEHAQTEWSNQNTYDSYIVFSANSGATDMDAEFLHIVFFNANTTTVAEGGGEVYFGGDEANFTQIGVTGDSDGGNPTYETLDYNTSIQLGTDAGVIYYSNTDISVEYNSSTILTYETPGDLVVE